MDEIILASQSPRRRELLSQIGIKYTCMPAIGEETVKQQFSEEERFVLLPQLLAVQKAEEIAKQVKDRWILAADTIVECEGEILGKPKDKEDARRMLGMLGGREHRVHTGVCLLKPGTKEDGEKKITFTETTKVFFYPVSKEEIEAYLESGEPYDKAGAYGIQGKAAAFIRGIEGDYNNVVGLPLSRVYQELKRHCLHGTVHSRTAEPVV